MSRLEEIKKRAETASIRIRIGSSDVNSLASRLHEVTEDYKSDVQYLLSKLETAEEALFEMEDNIKRISEAIIEINSDGRANLRANALINPAELLYIRHRLGIALQKLFEE